MSPRSRAANVVAALASALLFASTARADAPTAQAPVAQTQVVMVSIVGAGDAQPAFEGAIRELLLRLHVQMNTVNVGPESVLARVQIDLTSPSQATVLVTDGRTGEVRAHRLIPRDTSSSIMREEIAHAVQSAVESALIVEERAAPPPPVPAPLPPPPPPPVVMVPVAPPREAAPRPSAPRAGFALDLIALAGAGPVAPGVNPVVRIGGGLIASSRGALRPSLAVTAFDAVPFESQAGLVGSLAHLVSVRAVPSIELLHASWLALDVGAGGGVNVLTVQPQSTIVPLSILNPSTSRADAILTAAVTARAALASSVVFVVSVNADYNLAARHYVVNDGASRVTVFDPARVRPAAFAGLAFTALGDGLFAKRVAARESR